MAEHRTAQLGEEIRRELSNIIREDVKDPRVKDEFISVTHVDCTKDMKYATCYVSGFGKVQGEELVEILSQAKGFIRRDLAKNLNLRNTPELTFKSDDSIKQGARINELLKKVGVSEEG